MARNLDLTAVRAFVTVAESGGVTKAASQLHLTQSAVSMQLKRLEEALDTQLYSREGRSLILTSSGEQLLGYGRRMLALNDEVWGMMTSQEFEGELRFGVPHDIVYPHIPTVLQRMSADYPRVKVNLLSSYTSKLRAQFERGELDLILTTEAEVGPGGETLTCADLIWVGAPGGNAWRQRPLRLAFEYGCLFRGPVQRALNEAGIRWEMGVESDSSRTIEASISADLAVHACLAGSAPQYMEEIRHGGELPSLPVLKINAYRTDGPAAEMAAILGDMIRDSYARVDAKVA